MISSLGNLLTTLMVALNDLVGQFSYLAAFFSPKICIYLWCAFSEVAPGPSDGDLLVPKVPASEFGPK